MSWSKKMLSALVLVVLSVSSVYGAVDVVVSIPPQKWIVGKVGGQLVNCHVLVGEGQDPHTFEPTPKQMKTLSKAKIWFTMGMEFEEHLIPKIRDAVPDLLIVDTAQHIEKRRMQDHGEEKAGTGHQHDHNNTGLDPHVWLSPAHLVTLGLEMTRVLSGFDVDKTSLYEEKFDSYRNQLQELDEYIGELLAPFQGKAFYVFHPSFGYFADSYGLVQEPIEIEGKSPSPRQLSRLIKKARREGVKVIFVQPQFDSKSAASVAAAIDGSVVPLNALSENVEENLKTMAARIGNGLKSNDGERE